MALEEHDREDLLGEGRMMPIRGGCVIDGRTIVAGFRSGGQLSIYCDADPVFQFNADKELRRVFFEGRRFAAEQGHLIELVREKRGGKVAFTSVAIDPKLLNRLLLSWRECCSAIQREITVACSWRVVGGDTEELLDLLRNWLDDEGGLVIAEAPNA